MVLGDAVLVLIRKNGVVGESWPGQLSAAQQAEVTD